MLLGLDWAEPMIFFFLVYMSHVHEFSCIHTFISLYSYILMSLVIFCVSLFLPFSFFRLVASWHLNENPLYPRTLFVLGHVLLLTLHLHTYGSMMIKPGKTFWRTFVNEAFIWNAQSSYQIFLTLTYPLSLTVGVGGHFMTSWSLVPL